MSLEGTIRDLGLQEIGQLLSLGRKSGVLAVTSTLRGTRAWLRFVDGALVDAGDGAPLPEGTATAAAEAGDRAAVEEAVLDVLAWREGTFAFAPAAARGAGASRVRIPADAMLVESARREDVWSRVRDRIPSARAVPSFVDVEPKALPLLHLMPVEWEVLTRVDGERNLRTLAQLLGRELMDVVEIVDGLVRTGLLSVHEGGRPSIPSPVSVAPIAPAPASVAPIAPSPAPVVPSVQTPAPVAPIAPTPVAESSLDEGDDDLWIPSPGELAGFLAPDPDEVFDPLRAGLVASLPATATDARRGVTAPAHGPVASSPLEPSSHDGRPAVAAVGTLAVPPDADGWREAGNTAARRGDFESALDCWTRYLRAHERAPDADRVREAIGLAARLQALLHPTTGT
ncbi:MAG TPA: DUF4388 domain-containing protein [Gemmatimonadaceae bacterium]|nr:DUF4388 domain-containing protein [Gemmatimonadaceae bacterium]